MSIILRTLRSAGWRKFLEPFPLLPIRGATSVRVPPRDLEWALDAVALASGSNVRLSRPPPCISSWGSVRHLDSRRMRPLASKRHSGPSLEKAEALEVSAVWVGLVAFLLLRRPVDLETGGPSWCAWSSCTYVLNSRSSSAILTGSSGEGGGGAVRLAAERLTPLIWNEAVPMARLPVPATVEPTIVVPSGPLVGVPRRPRSACTWWVVGENWCAGIFG